MIFYIENFLQVNVDVELFLTRITQHINFSFHMQTLFSHSVKQQA